jgi:hypothetical protein
VVVQRGDSNVHFPLVVSALDIPKLDDGGGHERLSMLRDHSTVVTLRDLFQELSLNEEESVVLARLANSIRQHAIRLEIRESELIELLRASDAAAPPAGDAIRQASLEELRKEEFCALSDPTEHRSRNFEGDSYQLALGGAAACLGELIQSVSLIRRLREVRAVQGFFRLLPGDPERMTSVAEQSQTDWLPAAEVFGEGIFIRLHPRKIGDWRANLPASEVQRVNRLGETILKKGIRFLPPSSPEFIVIHGFAHLLMRQLTFDCGYASSSLRERIYCEPEAGHFGLLIYTADGDSEGTLGGLVRQGEQDRLAAVIGRALQACSWCAGDPLCFEGENQGMGGLNRAACHACMLVSETSCECANVLLDRRLLIGDRHRLRGLFRNFMDSVRIA